LSAFATNHTNVRRIFDEAIPNFYRFDKKYSKKNQKKISAKLVQLVAKPHHTAQLRKQKK
jgi:hypothetical protein